MTFCLRGRGIPAIYARIVDNDRLKPTIATIRDNRKKKIVPMVGSKNTSEIVVNDG